MLFCFFHPDFDRRLRNFTESTAFNAARGLKEKLFTAGRDFHPAPKQNFKIVEKRSPFAENNYTTFEIGLSTKIFRARL